MYHKPIVGRNKIQQGTYRPGAGFAPGDSRKNAVTCRHDPNRGAPFMTAPATGLGDRRNVLLILSLTAVFCGLAVWMVVPAPPLGFYWDDTWYLMMAEWLSGRPEHRELAWNMLHLRQYPPLFPFALSMSGDFLANQHSAFIMNALFLAAGTAVAMIWFVREEFSAVTMALAALLVMFNPVALYWLPTLFSEHLFILLATLALTLAASNNEWRGRWLVVGVIAALAVATRSAAWALVAGVLAHLVLQRRFLPLLWFAAGSAAGLLSVTFLKEGLPPAPNYLGGLSDILGTLGWEYLLQQSQALISGWRSLWGSGIGALLAAVLVIPGLFVRLKQNRPDAWFVLAYIGMLLAWPFPESMSRFLWPAMPAFLVAGHSSMALLGKHKHTSLITGVALALIFTASVMNGIGKTLNRLIDPPPGELAELSRMPEWTRSSDRKMGMEVLQARQQFLDDMKKIATLTDNKVCIYSELSTLVTAQALRVSLASPWNSLEEVKSTQVQCPYYYLIPPALPGTENAVVDRFGATHEELFRSLAPYDPEGKQLLGVFFKLKLPAVESP
jgi:hypothetical protein